MLAVLSTKTDGTYLELRNYSSQVYYSRKISEYTDRNKKPSFISTGWGSNWIIRFNDGFEVTSSNSLLSQASWDPSKIAWTKISTRKFNQLTGLYSVRRDFAEFKFNGSYRNGEVVSLPKTVFGGTVTGVANYPSFSIPGKYGSLSTGAYIWESGGGEILYTSPRLQKSKDKVNSNIHSYYYKDLRSINTSMYPEAPSGVEFSNYIIDDNTFRFDLSTTDPDQGDTHSYTLVTGVGDTDNNKFMVDGDQLKVKASPFKYQDSYTIRLKTLDSSGFSFEESYNFTARGLNQNPTNLLLSTPIFNENITAGS